jgi:NTE family protein
LDDKKSKRNDSNGVSITSSSSSKNNRKTIENVLILQGGGSLGAFGCGVFKAFAKRNIKIDIVAGTSIGGVNAAIIAGSKDPDHPEQLLEQFWLELSDSFVDLNHDSFYYFSIPKFMEQLLHSSPYYSLFDRKEGNDHSTNTNEKIKIKQIKSFYSSAIFGNDKMFKPRWKPEYANSDPEYFAPQKWTYIYDHSPLAKTLDKYIDYKKLNPKGNPNARLIITATNVLTARALVFDSSKQQITAEHILASAGYPLYNFPWIEVEKGVYAWDGGLLSNTPLREVIDASPVNDKWIFFVENYPKNVDVLPRNLPEVYHRARDIIFCNKTEHNVIMSKVISGYLQYIEELYQIVEKHTDHAKLHKEQLKRIRHKYKKYKEERGAEIKKYYIYQERSLFPTFTKMQIFHRRQSKTQLKKGKQKQIKQ